MNRVNKPLQTAKILDIVSPILTERGAEREKILAKVNNSKFDTWIKRCWFGNALGYCVHVERFQKTSEWERVQYVGLLPREAMTDDEGLTNILREFGCGYFTMHNGIIWGFKTLKDFDAYGCYLERRKNILRELFGK